MTDEVFDHWDDTLDYHDSFTYDPVGNRVQKSRDALSDGTVDTRSSFRFDSNDRLIDERSYDAADQVQSQTTHAYHYTQSTGYTATHQPHSDRPRSLLDHTYTYDLQGRLHTATVTHYNDSGAASSITRSSYDYDHTGIRISALNELDNDADGSFETRTQLEYLVDHHNHTGYQQVIRESHYDADTGLLLKTIDLTYGHDELHQTTTDYDSSGNITATVRHHFLHDGKSSVRSLLAATTEAAATLSLLQLYHYTAYGQLHALHAATGQQLDAAAALTNLLYNGEQFDSLTQQQYLRARYYNPATAHFNRLDPFFGNPQDPQSYNKYAYVHGYPVMGVDPSGMAWTISGLLNTIAVRGSQFANQYKNITNLSTSLYKSLVSLIVVLNYTLAYQDQKLIFATAIATPYNLLLLRKFNSFKPQQLQAFVLRRMGAIRVMRPKSG